MNQFQKNILQLIRCALTGQACTADCSLDWENVLAYGIKQKVLPLIYYGLNDAGISIPQPYRSRYLAAVAKFLLHNEYQARAQKEIRAAFEKHNIRYIVLKGTELKQYYPKPEQRPMGDIDILIDVAQYDQIRPIMKDMGYQETQESDHELVWHKKTCMIELHKRLIPSYNLDFYRYFGDGWDRAYPISENANAYRFSPEDNFIYLFTHFAKHYRDAGIGILHLIDLFVYLQKYSLDEAYLQKAFRELELWEFYGNILKTLDVCFHDGEPTPVTTHILNRMFGAGAYGSDRDHAISVAVKKTKRTKKTKRIPMVLFWKRVFMPYREMCRRHPVLVKMPVLLPVFWIYRLFSVSLFHRKRLHDEIRKLKLSDGQSVRQYHKDLQFVGLDFHFDE